MEPDLIARGFNEPIHVVRRLVTSLGHCGTGQLRR